MTPNVGGLCERERERERGQSSPTRTQPPRLCRGALERLSQTNICVTRALYVHGRAQSEAVARHLAAYEIRNKSRRMTLARPQQQASERSRGLLRKHSIDRQRERRSLSLLTRETLALKTLSHLPAPGASRKMEFCKSLPLTSLPCIRSVSDAAATLYLRRLGDQKPRVLFANVLKNGPRTAPEAVSLSLSRESERASESERGAGRLARRVPVRPRARRSSLGESRVAFGNSREIPWKRNENSPPPRRQFHACRIKTLSAFSFSFPEENAEKNAGAAPRRSTVDLKVAPERDASRRRSPLCAYGS